MHQLKLVGVSWGWLGLVGVGWGYLVGATLASVFHLSEKQIFRQFGKVSNFVIYALKRSPNMLMKIDIEIEIVSKKRLK